MTAMKCEHDSATEVDQTDPRDPEKVYRCHECDGTPSDCATKERL